MNARDYRKHLYSHRSHPAQTKAVEEASEKSAIFLSFIAFVACEYIIQLKTERIPSGLLFPFGFLFFWAFYYTYYQPGSLEKTLSSEKKWDLSGIPLTIMSSCIWFVKIVCVELVDNMISSLINERSKAPPRRGVNRNTPPFETKSQTQGRTQSFQRPVNQQRQETLGNHNSPPNGALPREITNALGILGIPEARDWSAIQKRYRELAKKYHPDLNPELTQAGNRFMLYDAAYRKLEMAKERYFKNKKT